MTEKILQEGSGRNHRIWRQPERSEEILNELLEKNKDLYKFEKMLEQETPTASARTA